jgi:alpha-beta hydrolase superfamily lysophospholipase
VLTTTYDRFRWGFASELTEADARAAYERYVIPTPGRVFFQAAFGRETRVHFGNATRKPLLITAGSLDRTVPASMSRSNFKKYRTSVAVTAFKEFEGRTHWLIAEPGWEEIADFAITWAEERI